MASKNQTSNQPGRLNLILLTTQKVLVITMVALVTLATCLLCVVGVYLYLWDRHGDKSVQSVVDAGRVVSVAQSNGLLTRSLVETTVGFYALSDGISLTKGEALTLLTRNNNRRYLCDASQRCTPLL